MRERGNWEQVRIVGGGGYLQAIVNSLFGLTVHVVFHQVLVTLYIKNQSVIFLYFFFTHIQL